MQLSSLQLGCVYFIFFMEEHFSRISWPFGLHIEACHVTMLLNVKVNYDMTKLKFLGIFCN